LLLYIVRITCSKARDSNPRKYIISNISAYQNVIGNQSLVAPGHQIRFYTFSGKIIFEKLELRIWVHRITVKI